MTSKIRSYFHLSGSHRLAGCFAVAALTGCAPDFNLDLTIPNLGDQPCVRRSSAP